MIKKISITSIISLSLCMICFSCSSINKKLNLNDDHFVEQMIESKIEEYTGLDIDLTP